MLSGTASLEALAAGAPSMPSLESEPVVLEEAEVLQAAWELSYANRQEFLPPGLHPTTPPLMIVLAWRTPDSPWGPFTMAQIRISCRSGVRPRGFVVGCMVDSERAAAEMSNRWGLPTRTGSVKLHRFYDSVVLDAGPGLGLTGMDPDPLGTGDAQHTVTTTLAHTPRGLRLVQLEPEYDLRRVERLVPRLDRFDAGCLGVPEMAPRHPVAATIGVGTVTVPRLRFVSRPDVTAFEGTETI